MNDERKTKAQLAEELADLRLQVADLRQREAGASEAEEALRESGQFLQAILDGIEDGITVRDRDFTLLQVNRWVEQMFAHEMPLVGKKCYRAFEQREEVCPWCPAIKTMETGNVFSQVVSVPVASGMTRWFELTGFPLRDAQGDIVGAIEHAKDITDRRDAEEALRKASEGKSLILSSLSEEVVYHDRDMGIAWANRAAGESAGLTPEQLVGRMCYEVWHGRKQPCDGCPVQEAMDAGAPAESEITAPDGRAWHVHGYPVFGDGGQIVGAVEIVRDISQRRQTEQVLRESEARYRAVVEDQTELICRFVPDCTLTFVNEAYCRYFGSTREEMTGINFLPLIPDEDRGAVVEHFASITPDSPLAEHEHRAVLPSGEVRWLDWTNRGIFDGQGRLVEFQAVGRDITERKRAEEDLRLAQASINAASDSIFWIAPDGRFMYVNDAACRTLGYTRDELLGMRVADMDPDYTHEKRAAQWERVKRGGVVTFESHHRTREGRVFPVEVTSNYLRFGDHEYEFGFAHDITDRKRAEEALRQSEANYRAIFDTMNDMLFVHDIETGDVVDFNQMAADVYGYTYEETDLLNEQFRRGTDPPYSHEDQIRWLRRAADQGPQLFEWLATDRNGRRFWVEVGLKRATIGGHDRLLAVLRNIEDRKHAEEALRRSEENYRVLFEESLDGIVVVADGRVAGANQAFADIHRMDPKDVPGMPITEFMHPDEREVARANIRSVLEGRAESHTERGRRAKRADGTFALIEVLVKRIDWEGGPAVLAIVRDITERVRLEEELRQAQKMEAVGQLAGGIAHDFSNLVTGILCHASLLKSESPSPEDVREAADLIEGAARRAAELTGQLLGFARRGKQRDVAVDLNAAARTSVRLLGRSLDPRIRVTMPFRDERAFVRGDPVQMEQVVLNLAMNARDAMPEGGEMTFTIQTLDVAAEDCKSRPGAEPGRYVVLSAADTGCGIPEAMRGRVFEPFFTTKPHGKGTGMGLAMVYGIVKDHGGWVEVDSEPGHGTTFRVFLPVAKAPADADLRAPPDAGRILVVDDEELVRNVVVRMLSSLGYEVATAADAREAVEYYRRFGRDVSVVIIDMVMPKMDGLGCFAVLRGLDPDVKALLATGCGNEDRVQAALDEGMAGLVRKPFQTKQLAKAVKQALTQ